MEIKTITMLPDDKKVFVKRILLENNFFSGSVCYLRKPYKEYKMVPKEHNLDSLIFQYSEDEYPSDALDRMILKAIKQVFPKAECRTSLQMVNTDLEHNRHWASQRESVAWEIIIQEQVPVTLPNYTVPFIVPGRQFQIQVECYYLKGVLKNDIVNNKQILFATCDSGTYQQVLPLAGGEFIKYSRICKS